MRSIRVANLKSFTSSPYRLLSQMKNISYQEAHPAENARMLNECEVDIALIPVTDFAAHGGYVGLDFGLAGRSKIDAVSLVSNSDISQLHTIYLDSGANSSVTLLRLLFMERWGRIPNLVRVPNESILNHIRENAGAMVIGDSALNAHGKYKIQMDLAEEWYRLTSLPFVFTVWAARPEALTREVDQELHTLFHRAVKARESIAWSDNLNLSRSLASDHISNTVIYHLDSDCQKGMSEFFKRAFRYGFLPDEPYRTARYSALSGEAVPVKSPKSISAILHDSVNGKRVGIADGVRLAEEAALPDLALAADSLRSRMFGKRSADFVINLAEKDIGDCRQLKELIAKITRRAQGRITLKVRCTPAADLAHYENLVHKLRKEFSSSIEALSIPQVLEIARSSGLLLQEIASRLVAAGVDSVPACGGEFLVDRIMRNKEGVAYNAARWINSIKWFHRFGAKSSATLEIDYDQSWEERFIHLQKLRNLQDETPGFRNFYLTSRLLDGKNQKDDTLLRASILARLFLDNIPNIQESNIVRDPIDGIFHLSFGANSIKIPLDMGISSSEEKLFDFIDSLRKCGMDFEEIHSRYDQPPIVN